MKLKTFWLTVLVSSISQGCDDITHNAEVCNYNGDYECGQCVCIHPFYGMRCELGDEVSEEYCKESADALTCSGRGDCIYGTCACQERENPDEYVSGMFCECTNFMCDRHNGLICGGPDRGECSCNDCSCKPGWGGSTCTCELSLDNCINPESGNVCSDNGNCECNQCKCQGRYSGKWCEECPTCRGQCGILKECVYCHAYGGRSCSLSHEEFSRTCDVNIERVTSLGDNSIEDERLCTFFDADDCRYKFAYHYDTEERQLKVRVETRMECPPGQEMMIPPSIHGGQHRCYAGGEFLITSEIQDLSPENKIKWTFYPYEGHQMEIYCPIIRIPQSPNCRKDMLIISNAAEHKRADKICRDISEYRWSTNENMKVTFKRSDSSAEFVCKVNCEAKELVTPAPYPCPSDPPPTPITITSCSDLDDTLSGPCRCYDCDGHISLHCSVCQACDLNIFAAYDFSNVDIELEVKLTCTQKLDLAGLFRQNAENIKYLKICVHDDLILPYTELLNLEALVYQDCYKVKFGICQIRLMSQRRGEDHDDRRARSIIRGRGFSSSPTKFIGTRMALPAESDVPNLIQLSLVRVNVTLTSGSLDFPHLKEVLIDSEEGLTVEANAFAGLSELDILVVNSCQEVLESQSFRITSPTLKQLTIQNQCLHSIASDAVTIDLSERDLNSRAQNDRLTIVVKVDTKFFDHIPMCPFRPLVDLDFVEMIWLSDLQCRSCGGIWYWQLSSTQYANLTATCFDQVSKSTMTLRDYTDNNRNMCDFKTGYPGDYGSGIPLYGPLPKCPRRPL